MTRRSKEQLKEIWEVMHQGLGWLGVLDRTEAFSEEELDLLEEIDDQMSSLYRGLELAYKEFMRSLKMPSPKDLLRSDASVCPILYTKYKSEKRHRSQLIKSIVSELRSSALRDRDPILKFATRSRIKNSHIKELLRCEACIFQLEFALFGKKSGKNIDTQEIENAKQVPIADVAKGILELKSCGGRFVCKCIFHDDNTPSLWLYPDSNTYWCFGCNRGGDVIDFVMKAHNYAFIEAIRYLIKLN